MKILNITSLLLSVLAFVFALFVFNKKDETAFVDIGKLQDGYKLKKELEEKARGRIMSLKNVLDSLVLVKKISPVSNNYTILDTNIARLQYEMNRSITEANKEISDKIWERLNLLIEKYGKSHHYELIVGANGAGTVLYGDEQKDITKNLIEYINNNYERGN